MAELALRRIKDGPTVTPTFHVPTAAPTVRPTKSPIAANSPTFRPTSYPTSTPSKLVDPVPKKTIYGSSASYESGFTEFAKIERRVGSFSETGRFLNTKGTWDANIMRGCKCDSSWAVGFGKLQRQLSEYFGPDCSLSKFLF